MRLAATDTAAPGVFEAIFHALEEASSDLIGPAKPRLLVIPVRDGSGAVAGGLWGASLFRWLQVEMLAVPEPMRGQGVGSALMALAETEARNRGCLGMQVDTFSSKAEAFYEKMGFSRFGVLDGCPPGHRRVFFQKRLVPADREIARP
jgi:GNAT superfamily N-acetyltransferase